MKRLINVVTYMLLGFGIFQWGYYWGVTHVSEELNESKALVEELMKPDLSTHGVMMGEVEIEDTEYLDMECGEDVYDGDALVYIAVCG